jgi:hypothetical protein
VDYANAFRRNSIECLHVVLHRLGNGHDTVGVLICSAFDPAGCVISAAELLDLPRPMRLE